MTSLKSIAVLAFLLVANPAWSRNVDFCKVVRTFDTSNLGESPHIAYEDCSGVAFVDYAKDIVKADCWPGAFELQEGKCEHSAENTTAVDDTKADENLDFGLQ